MTADELYLILTTLLGSEPVVPSAVEQHPRAVALVKDHLLKAMRGKDVNG